MPFSAPGRVTPRTRRMLSTTYGNRAVNHTTCKQTYSEHNYKNSRPHFAHKTLMLCGMHVGTGNEKKRENSFVTECT